MVTRALGRVRAGLRGLFRDPETFEFLIVQGEEDENYYVQFAMRTQPQPILYGEAVSNAFLSPEQKLGEEQIAELRRLGWSNPHDDQGNWWTEIEVETDGDL